MFTCSTLLLFPYPVPADIHGSVQHVTLRRVPVDVLSKLFLWFSRVKYLKCHHIFPPQEVSTVCAHVQFAVTYSLLYQSLFDLFHARNDLLFWGMCKVTPHFGCSSVADVYRYITG